MSNNNILFDANSGAMDSPVFMLENQVTIIATGMAPDDYITFEVLQLLSGDPAKLCGCRLTAASNATIELVKPLTCSMCGPEVNSQEVRLTDNNTFVILDTPQGALLRAIYHGTGVDDGTAKVWYNTSDTPDLTDAMRGCAPAEVWEDTGETRCDTENDILETQQSSSCGGIRWVPGEPFEWVDTGLRNCSGLFSDFVQMQQTSPCGDLRWIDVPDGDGQESIVWLPTGEHTCADGTYSSVERNQCGDIRLTAIGAVQWIPTGEMVCDVTLFREERNQCGEYRLVEQGDIEWVPTGVQNCEWVPRLDEVPPPNYTLSFQEVNPCGELRWTEPTDPILGILTSERICTDYLGAVTQVFTNPCGSVANQINVYPIEEYLIPSGRISCANGDTITLEYVTPCDRSLWLPDPNATPAWHNTGGDCSYSCDPDTGFLFRVEQSSCCGGGTRLVQVFEEDGITPVLPEWLSTGTYRCNSTSGMVELQDRSQCNEYRWTECSPITWTATGETRIFNGVSQLQITNPCGETTWQDIPVESIVWTLTGVQACVGGFYQNQETDGFGNVRVVATTEPCGCGDPVLNNSYDTGWQLYTGRRGQAGFVDNAFSYAHGMGVVPEFVTIEFRCINAQGNYTAGDIVVGNVHSADQQGGVSTGWAIVIDATDINLAFDYNNGASLHEWNGNSNFRPNNGDWEFRIRGYA